MLQSPPNAGGLPAVRMPVQELMLGDRLQMKKPHPCGADEWIVERLGADVAVRCTGCGRRVLLTRAEISKRVKRRITPAEGQESR